MKKNIAVLFVFISLQLFSQDPSLSTFINRLNADYKDIAVFKNNIYGITTCDSLVVWSIESDSIVTIKEDITNVVTSGDDKLLASSVSGTIYSATDPYKWEQDCILPFNVFAILLDNNNTPIYLSSKGIFYENRLYSPGIKSIPSFTPYYTRNRIANTLSPPTLSYVDKKNRIWLAYNYGEFGTDLCFFDLESHSFIDKHATEKIDTTTEISIFDRDNYKPVFIDSLPKKAKPLFNMETYEFPYTIYPSANIMGITEDKDGTIYISEGSCFMYTTGSLTAYDENDNSEYYRRKNINTVPDYMIKDSTHYKKTYTRRNIRECLGPITINPYNNTLYYNSNLGFFKLHKNSDNTYSQELITKLAILEDKDRTHYIGSSIRVQKMIFIDANRFVFLTSNNGIGYYDGYQTKYYK